jgi:hypothetical protein
MPFVGILVPPNNAKTYQNKLRLFLSKSSPVRYPTIILTCTGNPAAAKSSGSGGGGGVNIALL